MFNKGEIIEYQNRKFVISKTTGKGSNKVLHCADYVDKDIRFLTKMEIIKEYKVTNLIDGEVKLLGKYKKYNKEDEEVIEYNYELMKIDETSKIRFKENMEKIRSRDILAAKIFEGLDSKDKEIQKWAVAEAKKMTAELNSEYKEERRKIKKTTVRRGS